MLTTQELYYCAITLIKSEVKLLTPPEFMSLVEKNFGFAGKTFANRTEKEKKILESFEDIKNQIISNKEKIYSLMREHLENNKQNSEVEKAFNEKLRKMDINKFENKIKSSEMIFNKTPEAEKTYTEKVSQDAAKPKVKSQTSTTKSKPSTFYKIKKTLTKPFSKSDKTKVKPSVNTTSKSKEQPINEKINSSYKPNAPIQPNDSTPLAYPSVEWFQWGYDSQKESANRLFLQEEVKPAINTTEPKRQIPKVSI